MLATALATAERISLSRSRSNGMVSSSQYEYAEYWEDEYRVLEEWRQQHGVMAYFDNDTGHVTFTMGIVNPSDVPPNFTVVVYTPDQ